MNETNDFPLESEMTHLENKIVKTMEKDNIVGQINELNWVLKILHKQQKMRYDYEDINHMIKSRILCLEDELRRKMI